MPLAAANEETITIGGDLTLGRIGYGAMQLTGDQVWEEYPDHDGGIALLRHVVNSGITFIDTADVYGPHSNELLIREALYPYPQDLVIATKGGFVRGGHAYDTLRAVGNPNYLRQSVHMSLRRLGLDRIDLYYLHSGTATDAPFADQVGVLAEFKEQGLIRHIGPSNVTVEQFEAAREIVEIAALTANYNLGTRLGAAHLLAAERAGVVFSPWGPTRIDGPTPRTSARKSMKSRTATMRRPIRWRSPGCCVARRTPLPSRGRVRPATSTTTTRPAVSCSPLKKSAA
jgi:aryl-alcohol dehydrogenase-like predicted oxidoreductase